jgi:hypothetical protein
MRLFNFLLNSSAESSEPRPTLRPVWLMLSGAILIGAIGYAITKPVVKVIDTLYDSDSSDSEKG